MNEFIANLEPYANALGWTLIHFLWQGALIFIAYWFATRVLIKNKISTHYWIGMIFMIIALIVPIAEFIKQLSYFSTSNASLNIGVQFFASNTESILGTKELVLTLIQKVIPYLVLGWFASVLLISNSLLRSWLKLKKLSKEKSLKLTNELEDKFQSAIKKLKLKVKPLLVISEKIDVPATFGYFKPVLLIPASMLLKLPQQQMEAVLVHELCHIKRADFLHNIIQILVETLFFYNPFTRWVSKDIRKIREKCCDDMVLNLGTEPITYAKALTNIALLQSSINPTSLQIAANDGELLDRIKYLVLKKQNKSSSNISTMILFVLISSLLSYNLFLKKEEQLIISGQTSTKSDSKNINTVNYSIYDSLSSFFQTDSDDEIKEKVINQPTEKIVSQEIQKPTLKNYEIKADESIVSQKIDLIEEKSIKEVNPIIESNNKTVDNNTTTTTPTNLQNNFASSSSNYPKLIKMVNPRYSNLARKQGIEGTVILSFNISPNGRVDNISVDKSSHLKLLDGSARRALKQWRFDQRSINQSILNNRYQQIFSFNLEGGKQCINGDTGSRLTKDKLCKNKL